MATKKDRVCYRVSKSGQFKGDITAILPDMPANSGYWTCYAHIGQHSECSRHWYYSTRAATPAEYAALHEELTSTGYRLRIIERIARSPK